MTQYDGRIPPPLPKHTWAYEHSLPYISLCFDRSPTSKEYVDNISVTFVGSPNECSPTILMKILLLKEILYQTRLSTSYFHIQYQIIPHII